MSDLTQFQKFGRRKEVKQSTVKEVWCYTRVSSIDQKSNHSLANQKQAAERFAAENGFNLVKVFGGTYESGKNDFTRKEFRRLLAEVKKSRRKPYGILVYKMNRFSRSGGNGVALVTELVNSLGVNLIEIVSGIDTTTEKGQLELYNRLLAANEENLNRLDFTIPGLTSHLSDGLKLGSSPVGYDHFGPKVKDFQKRAIEQKIVVNDVGEKLRLAWQWKVTGESDSSIIKRLKGLGVDISKQKLSYIWRNPFYCGIIAHKMLDGNIVEGKHEALVDKDTFLKVQSIIEHNNQGYKVTRNVEKRPLNNSLYCYKCGLKMVGYEVKSKGLHYYKCNKCNEVSINAETSERMKKRTGAHNLFIELLESYQLDEKYLELFKLQMKKMLTSTDKSRQQEDALYKQQKTALKNKKEKLEERYAFGEIEQSIYEKYHGQISHQILDLEGKFDISGIDTSNLKSNLNKAVDFTQNVSKYWVSGNLSQKKSIQKLMFPEGLRVDTEKRQYLTSNINALFAVKRSFSNDKKGIKKGLPIENDEESYLVAGVGLEPTTFGL